MTRRQRLLNHIAPFASLLAVERRRTAGLRLALAASEAREEQLRKELERARAEACGWKSHHGLAVAQRRRALDVAMADLPGEAWDATDDAILGAWLHGEGGPA